MFSGWVGLFVWSLLVKFVPDFFFSSKFDVLNPKGLDVCKRIFFSQKN